MKELTRIQAHEKALRMLKGVEYLKKRIESHKRQLNLYDDDGLLSAQKKNAKERIVVDYAIINRLELAYGRFMEKSFNN
ncbi:MAG: hypothetical protein QNK20_16685 [Aureibaculum sp.]|nr:hypothetical protein [Aureibaculum sp.]